MILNSVINDKVLTNSLIELTNNNYIVSESNFYGYVCILKSGCI
jgi:hypothetical protein